MCLKKNASEVADGSKKLRIESNGSYPPGPCPSTRVNHAIAHVGLNCS